MNFYYNTKLLKSATPLYKTLYNLNISFNYDVVRAKVQICVLECINIISA